MASLKDQWYYLQNQIAFRKAPIPVLWRLAVWRLRTAFNRGATITLHRWEVSLYLPPQWRGVSKLIFAFREYYEPELSYLEHLLEPGVSTVDIGANFGIYTLVMTRIVGHTGAIFAFEPATDAFIILQHNIRYNGFENVHLFNFALSDTEGSAYLYHHTDPSRSSIGMDPTMALVRERVLTRTLDKCLMDFHYPRLRLIKADVEGAEELVFRGALETLSEYRPVIIFEVNPNAAQALGLQPTGAWEVLNWLGYRFYCLTPSTELRRLEIPPAGGNVIAIHSRV